MTYNKLIVENHGAVAVLKLNDPATLNAMGEDLSAELIDAFIRIQRGDIACRAVVLTGAGRAFCSGANLQGHAGGARSKDTGERLEKVINPFLKSLRELPQPIITAVNGPAAGIGCSLALMGDMIVCGESGYFLQAFRRIGLVPDGGSTWMLPRMIGKARAMEMMLLGEKVPSHIAEKWGLVNRVVADSVLMAETMELAQELAEGPYSLGLTRKLIWDGLELDHDEALDAERWAQKDAGASADAAEGVAAFLAKRPAKFTGK